MTDHSKAAAPDQKNAAVTSKSSTNMDFVMQLNEVYDQYIALKKRSRAK